MSDTAPIPWKRILIEGAAIVASILVAFSIDAWWQSRQEMDIEARSLARVAAELEVNTRRIEDKLQVIATTIEGTSTLLSWMGPEPEAIERDMFLQQWDELYGVGFFALQRSAIRDYLAKGHLDSNDNAAIRWAIAEWYASGNSLENQYQLLRVAHASLASYLQDAIPIAHVIGVNSLMSRHPASRFPFDHADFLSDPGLEGRLSLYLIRMEFFSSQAADLIDSQRVLVALLNTTIEEMN